jgi:hypothetical protein
MKTIKDASGRTQSIKLDGAISAKLDEADKNDEDK